jgi:hypothetical protein
MSAFEAIAASAGLDTSESALFTVSDSQPLSTDSAFASTTSLLVGLHARLKNTAPVGGNTARHEVQREDADNDATALIGTMTALLCDNVRLWEGLGDETIGHILEIIQDVRTFLW